MLRAKVEIKLKETTKEWLREGIVGDSLEFVIETFVQLIRELDAQGKLPALVFWLVFSGQFVSNVTSRAPWFSLKHRCHHIQRFKAFSTLPAHTCEIPFHCSVGQSVGRKAENFPYV